jgi:type II secretory pathway component PulC|tara:strand:+ start:2746 stop:3150 length:405 start_codon:yes stop_codon:yes gene_type:complete
MNFIRFKQVAIMILALPALYFLFLLFLSFINKPVIKDINVPDMTNFEFKSNQNDMSDNYNQVESSLTFDYKLIGYRAGSNNSSVILKKGNKEYLVAKGEKLEGVYELIEVSKDEVVFRKDEKLYKIENLVGTSL